MDSKEYIAKITTDTSFTAIAEATGASPKKIGLVARELGLETKRRKVNGKLTSFVITQSDTLDSTSDTKVLLARIAELEAENKTLKADVDNIIKTLEAVMEAEDEMQNNLDLRLDFIPIDIFHQLIKIRREQLGLTKDDVLAFIKKGLNKRHQELTKLDYLDILHWLEREKTKNLTA